MRGLEAGADDTQKEEGEGSGVLCEELRVYAEPGIAGGESEGL